MVKSPSDFVDYLLVHNTVESENNMNINYLFSFPQAETWIKTWKTAVSLACNLVCAKLDLAIRVSVTAVC